MPPLNGSGTYAAPASTWNPAVTSTVINSTDWAALLADLTTALSTAMYKDGQATPTANIPMGSFKLTGLAAGNAAGNSLRYEQLFTTSAVALLGAMDWVKGADVASATTTNLTTATGNAVHITGTTTITAITLGSGMWRIVIFDGALTLTHHATNNNLPGGANITTAAGDRAMYWSDGTTVYCVLYVPVASSPLGTTGTATHKGLLDISAAAAGQIKFPATQNASSDANTLDDYEEGTWTPTADFGGGTTGITYTAQLGTYTKVGRVVTVNFSLLLSSKGSSGGTFHVAGLPFTIANDSANRVAVAHLDNLATAIYSNVLVGLYNTTTAAVKIVTAASTSPYAFMTDVNASNTLSVWGTLVYTV